MASTRGHLIGAPFSAAMAGKPASCPQARSIDGMIANAAARSRNGTAKRDLGGAVRSIDSRGAAGSMHAAEKHSELKSGHYLAGLALVGRGESAHFSWAVDAPQA